MMASLIVGGPEPTQEGRLQVIRYVFLSSVGMQLTNSSVFIREKHLEM